MSGTTTIYGIHYPVLSDAANISGVQTTASDIDTLISKLDVGAAIKQRVAAIATTNINLSSLPTTIDGVTMAAGDLFLCTGQSTASQNGVQTWVGAAGVATRPAGFTSGSAGAGQVAGGHVVAGGAAGTSNGGVWQCTNTGAITVDTTGLTYVQIAAVAGVSGSMLSTAVKQAAAINDGTSVTRGKSNITTVESTASTTAVFLTTNDVVNNVVVPTDALIFMWFYAEAKCSGGSNARPWVYFGANEVVMPVSNGAGSPGLGDFTTSLTLNASWYTPIVLTPYGFTIASDAASSSADSFKAVNGQSMMHGSQAKPVGAVFEVQAGTYNIGIKWSNTVGGGSSTTVRNRLLRVKVEAFV